MHTGASMTLTSPSCAAGKAISMLRRSDDNKLLKFTIIVHLIITTTLLIWIIETNGIYGNMTMKEQDFLFIGPQAAGKTCIMNALLEKDIPKDHWATDKTEDKRGFFSKTTLCEIGGKLTSDDIPSYINNTFFGLCSTAAKLSTEVTKADYLKCKLLITIYL